MAVDEPTNLLRVPGEDGPTLEERGAVAPSEPEEELVTDEGAHHRNRDHRHGIEIAAMGGECREHQHRLAFQQAAEGQDPIAMLGDERRDTQSDECSAFGGNEMRFGQSMKSPEPTHIAG